MIDRQEGIFLDQFGHTQYACHLLSETKQQYFASEIKEKSLRWKVSPYSLDKPVECAYKAAPLFLPYALGLAAQGRQELTPVYKEIFESIMAVSQIIDDLGDLEADIEHGHFSLATVGIEQELLALPLGSRRQRVLYEPERLVNLYMICNTLTSRAAALAAQVDDPMHEAIALTKKYRVHQTFLREEMLA
jgi:hypothetical protein